MTEENGVPGSVEDAVTENDVERDDGVTAAQPATVDQDQTAAVDQPATVDQAPTADHAATVDEEPAVAVPPQYGIGPFSVREVVLVGIWFVAFVVSFFSRSSVTEVVGLVGLGASVWGSGLDWILTIGVPTVAVGLIVLRRLSPTAIRRVGSLGIDQFASVAFSVSAVVWLSTLWNAFALLAVAGVFLAGWVPFVSFLLMLAGVVFTVFAPLLPVVGEDFAYREEQPAHRVARPLRPISPRPEAVVAAPGPWDVPAAPAEGGAAGVHGQASVYGDAPAYAGVSAPDDAVAYAPAYDGSPVYGDPHATGEQPAYAASAADEAPAADESSAARLPSNQPFWALAPGERDVIDETGAPIFRVGPTAWALVLEDRVDYYVVRHDDGRIGYLMDVAGVTRG